LTAQPSYYPPALEWDEQDPDNIQQEPPVDAMYCAGYCLITPCLFIQWQEEIERTDALLDPGENNRVRWFRFYRNMTREIYGHLGKGIGKPLPGCFVQ
jgi:hypothetical protein